jgi:hypothetical protein
MDSLQDQIPAVFLAGRRQGQTEKPPTCLLTRHCGADVVGSNIVEEMLRRGKTIRVIDNFLAGRGDSCPADAVAWPPNLDGAEVSEIPGKPV